MSGLTSFYFNGRGSNEFPWLIINRVEESILPPIEQKMIKVPGRPGTFHAGRTVGERVDRIAVTILADSKEERAQLKRILADWLDTDSPQSFWYSYEPDKQYKAFLNGSTDLEKIVTDGEVQLEFIIPDPWAVSPVIQSKQIQTGIVAKGIETTQADWEAVGSILTNLDTTSSIEDVKLAKEGTTQKIDVTTNWDAGTHMQTAETIKPDGSQVLTLDYEVLGGTSLNVHVATAEDKLAGTISNLKLNYSDNLVLSTLPSYYSIDNMTSLVKWSKYGSVTQSNNYVTISSSSVYSGIRQLNKVTFPMTFDFYAKVEGNSLTFWVSDGTNYKNVPLPQSLTGAYSWYRIRCTTSTVYVYKDGSFVTSYSYSTNSPPSNRWALEVSPNSGMTCSLEVFAYAFSDLGAASSGTYLYSGTWTKTYNLSQIRKVKSTSIRWASFHNGSINDPTKLITRIETSLDGTTYTQVSSSGNPIPGINAGDDLNGKTLYVRITLQSLDPTSSPEFMELFVDVIAETNQYYTSGNRISPLITTNIQAAGVVSGTKISWEASVPTGTSISVETNVSLDGINWLGWKPMKNGDPIPDLPPGTNVASAAFQYKISLTTSDPAITPEVSKLTYQVVTSYKKNGERISPGFDLTPIMTASNPPGDSFITWDETFFYIDATGESVIESLPQPDSIQVDYTLDGGATWTPVAKGTEIPGIRGARLYDSRNMISAQYCFLDTDSNGDGVADGWVKNPSTNSTVVFSIDPVEKAQKIQITNATGVGYPHLYSLTEYSVMEGQTYTFSVDYKTAGFTGTFEAYIRIEWKDSNGSLITLTPHAPSILPPMPGWTDSGKVISNTLNWTRTKVTTTAPTGAAKAVLKLETHTTNVGDGGTVWFKNAKLAQGTLDKFVEIQFRQKLSTVNVAKTPVLRSFYFEIKEGGDTIINYTGTAEAYPTFTCTFNQAVTGSFQILHTQTGKKILIERDFSMNDVLVIDMATQKLLLNGVYDPSVMRAINVRESDFFPLISGINSFLITPSEGVEVKADWAERWK